MEKLFGHTPRVFKKILYISIAAHLIVIVALGLYMGGKKKVFFSPVYTVSLVEGTKRPSKRRTKRVHVRAAKKKRVVKKRVIRKKVVRKKAAKKAVVVRKKVVRKKKAVVKAKRPSKAAEKDLSNAISTIRNKVRAQEERELITSKIEAIKRRQEAEELARRLAKIRGSIKAAPRGKAGPPLGAASSGISKESLQLKHKAYFSLIRDRVQENWIYPESFENKKVSVIVSIRIGKDGELLKSWVEKSSGSSQFDDSLLKAVRKASPFPPLPEDFTEDILETGLRFCPACE